MKQGKGEEQARDISGMESSGEEKVDGTRRQLLQAGWTLPVVATIVLRRDAHGQSSPSHGDANHDDMGHTDHQDGAHGDQHGDSHGDSDMHVDQISTHIDQPGHNDRIYQDQHDDEPTNPHVDMHTDNLIHDDTISHADETVHVDLHRDETNHVDTHTDS